MLRHTRKNIKRNGGSGRGPAGKHGTQDTRTRGRPFGSKVAPNPLPVVPGSEPKFHGRHSKQEKAIAAAAAAKAKAEANFPVLPSKLKLREEIVNKAKTTADILNKLANAKLRANVKLRATANEFVPPQSINKVNKEKQEKEKQKPEIERAVAVDCEMIQAGEPVYLPGGSFGAPHVLAQVVIVDFNGKTLLDRYVLPEVGLEGVVTYLTEITGINYNTLKGLDPKKHSRNIVIKEVKNILKDRIVVGHQLSSDFKALDYNPEENNNVIFDTATINTFMNPESNRVYGKTAKKLKDITKQFVGYNIQNKGKPHDPLEDAIAPMNIFRKCLGYGLIK